MVCCAVVYEVGFRLGLTEGIMTTISAVLFTKMIRSGAIVFRGVGVSGKIANFASVYMFRD